MCSDSFLPFWPGAGSLRPPFFLQRTGEFAVTRAPLSDFWDHVRRAIVGKLYREK